MIKFFKRQPTYVIIDVDIERATLTCLARGSRGVFKRGLLEVSLDPAFIQALDVRQACYVGLKVAEYVQYHSIPLPVAQEKQASMAGQHSSQVRYVSFDRQGHVVYVDPDTDCLATHPALEIAKDERLIQKFPPDIAYAIGLYVGRRLYHRPAGQPMGANVVSITS